MNTTDNKKSRLQLLLSKSVFPMIMVGGLSVMALSISAGWSLSIASFAITGVALGIGLILERWMPWKGASSEEGELKTDLLSMGMVTGLLEPALTAWTPILVTMIAIPLLPVTISIFPSSCPLYLQFFLVVLLAEFGKYWAHRLSHEYETLWRFHAMHHSSHRLNILNNFRVHPINHILSHTMSIAPLILLGAGPEVMMLYNVFFGIGIIFQHIDADLEHGVLNRWFSTNTVHRWHHSTTAPEGDTNYGAVLIIWDRMFGTYYAPANKEPAAFGLYDERGYPLHHFWGQLLIPFCWKKQNCLGISWA